MWLGALIAVVVLIVLATVSLTGRSDQSSGGANAAAPTDPLTVSRLAAIRRDAADPLALGSVTAPVVVSEWGDFQCPFCQVFATRTAPVLLREYVDSGRVRLEWHDYAYLGPESVLAARAARAAGRQGKFWEFHDALYRDQPSENTGATTEASLTAMARTLGLDVPRFTRDYDDPAITAAIDADRRLGAELGITRVPSFLANGQFLFGSQPIGVYQKLFDDAAERTR